MRAPNARYERSAQGYLTVLVVPGTLAYIAPECLKTGVSADPRAASGLVRQLMFQEKLLQEIDDALEAVLA
mgnify:CR=1 FL=1